MEDENENDTAAMTAIDDCNIKDVNDDSYDERSHDALTSMMTISMTMTLRWGTTTMTRIATMTVIKVTTIFKMTITPHYKPLP